MSDRYVYAVLAGFAAGILARSFLDVGISFSVFWVLIGATLCAYAWRIPKSLPMWCAVLICAAGLGMLRFDIADRTAPKEALASYVGQRVTLKAVISDEPDERETNTRYRVQVKEIEEKPLRIKTTVLLAAPREPAYVYGDLILVKGVIRRPKNFTDEVTLREVDYVAHLAKDGIHYEMFLPSVERVGSGKGNLLIRALFSFKRSFIASLNESIPQPHASLLAGLVAGAKQSLGKKLLDDFRTTGVIHIVVLSGYNITIIAAFIEWLFSALSRNKRLILSVIGIVLFALMVGASATVVRATIMALLVILARSTGRLYNVTRALLIAGFFMILHNPKILVFDTSFQLSFLATVGLIYVSPLIEPYVSFVTDRWKLREIAVATISTQIFVLPFLLYKTGLLSLVSLPANLLVLSAIPLTMLLGFLAGMAGMAFSVLALPFAYAAYALLAYELSVIEWFARLPFAAVSVPALPFWLIVLWYGAYAWCLFAIRKRPAPILTAGVS